MCVVVVWGGVASIVSRAGGGGGGGREQRPEKQQVVAAALFHSLLSSYPVMGDSIKWDYIARTPAHPRMVPWARGGDPPS